MGNKIYKEALVKFILENIDFQKYDNIFENSALFIVPSSNLERNLNSKYYSLLNFINLDNLDKHDLDIINNKNQIDAEVIEIVRRTYKRVLKRGNFGYTMYNPPMPSHRVINGSLVLEMVAGKSNCNYSDEDYAELIKKQRQFINSTNKQLEKEIENKFDIPCKIFFDKRI